MDSFEEWYEDDDNWVKSEGEILKDGFREAWDAAYKQAYSDAYADAAYPVGYVLVPVEPTEKVIDAFWKVVEEDKEARISNVYRAMIQAAQVEN